MLIELNENELRGVVRALEFAIDTQRKYERETWNYTMDSGTVGGWQEIHDRLLSRYFHGRTTTTVKPS